MGSRRRSRSIFKCKWAGLLGLGLIALISFIPLRLAIALHQAPVPQALFVLGGDLARVEFAGQFWQTHPDLTIWVSDLPRYEMPTRQMLQQQHIPPEKVRYDDRATDTVTNFTSMAKIFADQGLHHVYLVTSTYHMPRARAIAALVFGSYGIAVTPLELPSNAPLDANWRVLRDCLRSSLWLVTGRSGASFNPRLH